MVEFRLTRNLAKTEFHTKRKEQKKVTKTESGQTRTKAKTKSRQVPSKEVANKEYFKNQM